VLSRWILIQTDGGAFSLRGFFQDLQCVGEVGKKPRMNKNSSRLANSEAPGAVAVIVVGILLIAGFRVLRATLLPELPNFSPLAAVAFCGGLFLPGAMAWVLPLAILFLSDFLLSVFLGFPMWSSGQAASWAAMVAIVGIGRFTARAPLSLGRFFGAVFGSGVLFYLATNTMAWIMNPAYPRGLDGLAMSLTTGLPGYPPSWVFFRNGLLSDFLFAGAMFAVWAIAVQTAERRRAVVNA
jgi:hypothetical protein